MTAFLIVALVFVSLITLTDLVICLGYDGKGDIATFGLALLNLFPLVMAIIAISLSL